MNHFGILECGEALWVLSHPARGELTVVLNLVGDCTVDPSWGLMGGSSHLPQVTRGFFLHPISFCLLTVQLTLTILKLLSTNSNSKLHHIRLQESIKHKIVSIKRDKTNQTFQSAVSYKKLLNCCFPASYY